MVVPVPSTSRPHHSQGSGFAARPMRMGLAALILGAAVALSGCAEDIAARGNQPKQASLDEMVVGQSTRGDAQALLGTPSATSMFGGESWYYISAETEEFAFFGIEELSRQVVALRFGMDGRLEAIDVLAQSDGQTIEMVGRETPTRGNDISILQELFGNVGRFAPRNPE